MLFSAFTPLGLFAFSSETPRAQRMYESLVANHGGEFDMSIGTRQEALCYARALATARAEQAQRRGQGQAFPETVVELLSVREAEYELTPGFTETTASRREQLARRMRRPPVWTLAEMVEALRAIVGDDLIALRPTPIAETINVPATIDLSPLNLQRPDVPRKVVRLTAPVSIGLGAPQSVTYELIATPRSAVETSPADLIVGDVLVVEPEVDGIAERVSVIAVGSGAFEATFENPHSTSALACTHPWARWFSSKRHFLVILTPTAAADPIVRTKLNAEMRRMARVTSTWSIVGSTDGLVTDEIIVGAPGVFPGIGIQTIGQITI